MHKGRRHKRPSKVRDYLNFPANSLNAALLGSPDGVQGTSSCALLGVAVETTIFTLSSIQGGKQRTNRKNCWRRRSGGNPAAMPGAPCGAPDKLHAAEQEGGRALSHHFTTTTTTTTPVNTVSWKTSLPSCPCFGPRTCAAVDGGRLSSSSLI